MRWLVSLFFVLALGVMACSETSDCVARWGDCVNSACCPGLFCETFVDDCENSAYQPGKRCELAPTSECRRRPGDPPYVCGCDGNIYETECEARQAGVDTGDVCGASPLGHFPCGPMYCEAPHYCSFLDANDIAGEEVKNDYWCADLPEACEGIGEDEALCVCLDEELVDGLWQCRSVSGNGVTGIFVEVPAI